MSLTAHYIDVDWKLRKKIINFCPIPNHAGETIGKFVEHCLVQWGIERVLTVTVDNASSNDVGIKYLQRQFKKSGSSILDGDFLHMRCGAHILGLIVRDGLSEIHESIFRIRGAVRYVRSSTSRADKFKECLIRKKLSTKCGVCLDVETRWNSTYLMLESAIKLRSGFDMLASMDDKYVADLRKNGFGPPTAIDWDYVESLLPILECFYEATLKVSGTRYVTGNEYMKEIFAVGWKIQQVMDCDDPFKRSMAERMKKKFDKYWLSDDINVIIFIATVVDPRFKLTYVNFMIKEIYNDEDKASEMIGKVKSALENLFEYYKSNRFVETQS
ncbi:PREDICTED: zinc finger BED domain-containing protein RICESLEEPER 2-like [Tarenaya hassleriana]|uniref:zinc finger BED domain-containing protein RICESLEEPER 2-like n=1 Tax=Tarenaya hassleriana TaxID=28532 RepID=UPI00053C6739|nr:PREDICTED: zinc finger BED domain-containing protein RICESLEEPER 2-like [Tarenaya hassleriana]